MLDMNKIDELVAMSIVAFGCYCVEWMYFPKLPTPFSQNLPFVGMYDNKANLYCLSLDDSCGVKVWFEDEIETTKTLSLEELKLRYPLTYVSLITHICDMIENGKI